MGKEEVNRLTIAHKGMFDFNGLLSAARKWIKLNEFDMEEKKFKQKGDGKAGTDFEIQWIGERDVTEYIRYYINVKFYVWSYNEVDVVRNGSKIKLGKARMRIIIWSEIETDYEKTLGGTPTKEKLAGIFHKYILDTETGIKYADQLYYMVYALQKTIKEFLDMETKYSAF